MNHEKGNQKLQPGDLVMIVMKPGTESFFRKAAINNIGINARITTRCFNVAGNSSWRYKEETRPIVTKNGKSATVIPEAVMVKISGPDIDTTETVTITKIIPKESPLFQD